MIVAPVTIDGAGAKRYAPRTGGEIVTTPFEDTAVAAAYDDLPEAIRERLLALRELVLETAAETEGVAGFAEGLRWGEPSFLTKSGSTVRISQAGATRYGVYFNCQSKLVPTFRSLFPDRFDFEGNRALLFDVDAELPADELRVCLALAMTYHKRKHLDLLGA